MSLTTTWGIQRSMDARAYRTDAAVLTSAPAAARTSATASRPSGSSSTTRTRRPSSSGAGDNLNLHFPERSDSSAPPLASRILTDARQSREEVVSQRERGEVEN